MRLLLIAVAFCFSISAVATEVKDWTFLVFINGHNNLDKYGAIDINEMEKIGSTDKVNVVVQWASLKNKDTYRLLVQKDSDFNTVTSPVVQKLPQVDMGDAKSLVEFAKWGAENYPARHYFIAVWNHGSGWHRLESTEPINKGISYDDVTGHYINTYQLGTAMDQVAAIIGHKVDIYGSDACLMGMPEVATQMKNSVSYFVGSEETEPLEGWPYDTLLAGWNALPSATAEDVSKILVHEYVKSYMPGGTQKTDDVTMSAFNLADDRTMPLAASMKSLGASLAALKLDQKKKVVDVVKKSQVFAYTDYVDLGDFVKNLAAAGIDGSLTSAMNELATAHNNYVIANAATSGYSKVHGAAVWLPNSKSVFNNYYAKYKDLEFNKLTGWGEALKALFN